MSMVDFIITSVARAAENDETSTFMYQDGKQYKKLIEWEHFDEVILGKYFNNNRTSKKFQRTS